MEADQKSLAFQKRDEFDQELYGRPFSTEARFFLQLMFLAANGSPPDGISGDVVRSTQFVMMGEQIALADQIGISRDIKPESRCRAVRRVVDELEGFGILKRAHFVEDVDGKPTRRLFYSLSLLRLIDLPSVDLSTEIGRCVASVYASDPWDDDAESTDYQQPSGGLSGQSSGGLSGPSKTPVLSCPVPVAQNSNSSNPDPCAQESGFQEGESFEFELQEGPVRQFNDLPDKHVRAIGGFAPGGRNVTDGARRDVFLEYFRDAVACGFAAPADALLLLAIFRAAAVRMGDDQPANQRVRSPMMWIRSVWNSRHTKPPQNNPLIKKSVAFARRILEAAEVTA